MPHFPQFRSQRAMICIMSALTLLSGCFGGPNRPPVSAARSSAPPTAAVIPAATTVPGQPPATVGAGAVVPILPPMVTPVVSNNGASAIQGSVRVPASIIGHNGGSIIGDQGSGIIGHNGGSIIGHNGAVWFRTTGRASS